MNINPKDKKNYHQLTVCQKQVFFTTLHKSIKGLGIDYGRMFTEPRKYGYRCKLWMCSKEPRLQSVANRYIKFLKKDFADCPAVKDIVITWTRNRYYGFYSMNIHIVFNPAVMKHIGMEFTDTLTIVK